MLQGARGWGGVSFTVEPPGAGGNQYTANALLQR